MSLTFASNLPFSFFTAVIVMSVAFVCGRRLKRYAVVDVFWGPVYLVLAGEAVLVAAGQGTTGWQWSWWRLTALALVAVWSARLSLHLGIRQRGHGEDPRYVVILRGAKPGKEASFAYTRVFLLQATLAWFISLPLQWLAFATSGGRWLTWLGLVSAVKGLFFEAVGDYQLKKFRERPDASTTVLQTGLWKYTRHPNYFGDALFWWGVFAIVAGTPWGWVFAPAPVLMNWLLTSLSGKPLLERSLKKSKPGYEEYVARTSSFIPWFPKKN